MHQGIYQIQEHTKIAEGIYSMTLRGETSVFTAPGQFLNIRLEGFYLRRPISVCDWDASCVTILYRVVGGGTAALSRLRPGAALDVLAGLGNGFHMQAIPDGSVLVGGGIGVPPLYGLAKRLVRQGKRPSVILGFKNSAEAFYESEFRALGVPVQVATEDGSLGAQGFVTALLPERAPYVCACGPEPMLKAVYARCRDGQFSFEARMACGFGACMGCSCETKYGYKRICKDGPVLERGEIVW